MSSHSSAYRTHTCGELTSSLVGDLESMTLSGYLQEVNENNSFVLRDRYGQVLVFLQDNAPAYLAEQLALLQPESVIKVTGYPDHHEVDGQQGLCVRIKELEVLSESSGPPTSILSAKEVSPEERQTLRQLYLRRPDVQQRMALKTKLVMAAREFLVSQGFLELETPQLFWYDAVATDPEPVPAGKGRSFALPSGPVVLNQYLKAGQFDRFFQFVRVTRREDSPTPMHANEYTALDINMAYVEVDDFCKLVEGLIAYMAKEVLDIDIPRPFPSYSHDQALDVFGSDKPGSDSKARTKDFEPVWVHTYPFFSEDQDGNVVPDVVVFSRVLDDDLLKAVADPEARHEVRSQAFDLVMNGVEMASGYIGNHNLELQKILWENLFMMEGDDLVRLRAPIEAHRFGLAPHGGMNLGIERLVAVLLGVDAIDELMAFPKDHRCRDLMLGAPDRVDSKTVADFVEDGPKVTFTTKDLLKEVLEQ